MTTITTRENLARTILVTNDDGVYAPGIRALFKEMSKLGNAYIIAPERDNSAASHSLTMNRPLRVRQLEERIYAIDGTPTDCVTIGVAKVLTVKPDLVVSGINPGGNLGDDISYSGTVSAAKEGTMMGIPSLAVSMPGEPPLDYGCAAAFAAQLAGIMLERGLPKDTLLNVNFPAACSEFSQVKFTRQGRRKYDDAVKDIFDPWGRKHYWIGGGTPVWDKDGSTDSAAILSGAISITPIHLDLTNHNALNVLKEDWSNLF